MGKYHNKRRIAVFITVGKRNIANLNKNNTKVEEIEGKKCSF